eukprot:3716824-Rhodomonas_salina.2
MAVERRRVGAQLEHRSLARGRQRQARVQQPLADPEPRARREDAAARRRRVVVEQEHGCRRRACVYVADEAPRVVIAHHVARPVVQAAAPSSGSVGQEPHRVPATARMLPPHTQHAPLTSSDHGGTHTLASAARAHVVALIGGGYLAQHVLERHVGEREERGGVVVEGGGGQPRALRAQAPRLPGIDRLEAVDRDLLQHAAVVVERLAEGLGGVVPRKAARAVAAPEAVGRAPALDVDQ